LAFASVFIVGQRQANAIVAARILLTKSHSQLGLAEAAGETGLAVAVEVAACILVASAAIATWLVLAR